MKGYAIEKVEGGKLVKIKVDFGTHINSVQILGDFFLHPEDTVFELENRLKGQPANESTETLQAQLEDCLKEKNAKLVGMTAEAIVRTLVKAMEEGKMKAQIGGGVQ